MNSTERQPEVNHLCDTRRFRPILLLLFLAFLPGSVAGDAGHSPGSGTRGVQVTKEVPFVRESIGEIQTLHSSRPTQIREGRAIHSHRITRRPGEGTLISPPATSPALATMPSGEVAASVASLAPVLLGSFQGPVNPPHGRDVIPPNAMGAAGPFQLVAMPVSDFGVFDKVTGEPLESVPLDEFWADLVTNGPADFPFDTRILFDQHSGRFVAVALDCTVNPNSWLMIAVSATDNALGVWNKWAIDADRDAVPGGGTAQTPNWADFPGVGIDAHNLYVAANMFQGTTSPLFQYSKLWVIPKAQLLAGPTPSLTWVEFPNPPGSLSTLQPAHVFGPSSTEYVVFEDWNFNATRLLLATIDNVTETPVWHPPVPIAVAPYRQEFGLRDAPQAVEIRGIDTADTRLWNAVVRNGFLWTTHHVDVGNKTEAAWYRIDPVAGTVDAQGRIRDPIRWYYFPSIAVRQDNVAAIGFSGSSSREYAGGYYTILRPPYTAEEPVALLKSGEDTYFKEFGTGVNRWGDLSATVVDPSDGVTFWTIQEYAWTHEPVRGDSRWALWWGKFRPSDVTAPIGLTATASAGPQVVLNWTDASLNETGFLIERRRLPGQNYVQVDNVAQNVTTYTDNASTGLLGGFTYSYRLQAFNATGGSYSAEAFASTTAPPPPPSSGGGGGCLAITPASTSSADASSVLSLLILFLPAAVYGWKRHFPC